MMCSAAVGGMKELFRLGPETVCFRLAASRLSAEKEHVPKVEAVVDDDDDGGGRDDEDLDEVQLADDEIDRLGENLRLPGEVLRLAHLDNTNGRLAVKTRIQLDGGTLFGPFRASLLPLSEYSLTTAGSTVCDIEVVVDGKPMNLRVDEETGGWLRCIQVRKNSNDDEDDVDNNAFANCRIAYQDGEVCLTLTSDVAPDESLVADFKMVLNKIKVEQTTEKTESRESPASSPRPPPSPECILRVDGDESDVATKHLTTAAAAVVAAAAAAAAPSGSVPDKQPAFKCGNCGICFSSPRNLAAHTFYYCTQRSEQTSKSSEGRRTPTPPAAQNKAEMILSEAPMSIKRSLSPSTEDDDRPQSKSPKSDRVFQCPYCTYTTDRKGSLTRHLRVHVVTPEDVVPLVTPASARYCANCDIQFTSFKTYTVHKQYYCNTRSVQKPASTGAATPSPSGTPNSTSKTPALPTVTPQQLANQPLFAAISTNPLVLVPCAYVPGSGLVPIQAGATAPDGTPITTGAIQIAAGAGMSGAVSVGSLSPRPTSASRDKEESILPDRSTPKEPENSLPSEREPMELKKEIDSAPLDLSTTPKKEARDGSSTPGSVCDLSMSSQDVEMATDLSQNVNGQKQGTFRCDECNIMFFKLENFAAHKRHYCAGRQRKLSVSTEVHEEESKNALSSVIKDSSATSNNRSPSPRSSSERLTTTPKSESERTPTPSVQSTSPATQPVMQLPSVGSQPVFQFYCIACGIKFTSLNNLQAHQTYYCPKREVLQGTVRVGVVSRPVMEMQCPKCRITYPNEDQLKAHACCARKCPYCDVYCSSHSAAQRHLATHAGIKAFKCTFCGYKGHTLRGMRTHVRIHVEKGALIQEENFIVCVGENGEPIPPPPSGANIMHFLAAKSPSLDSSAADRSSEQASREDSLEQRLLSATSAGVCLSQGALALCQDVAKTSNSSPSASSASDIPPPERERLSPSMSNSKGSPVSLSSSSTSAAASSAALAVDPANSNPESPAKPEMHHWCNFCGYSSSYKGNVVRHIKLIHRDVLAGGLTGLGQQPIPAQAQAQAAIAAAAAAAAQFSVMNDLLNRNNNELIKRIRGDVDEERGMNSTVNAGSPSDASSELGTAQEIKSSSNRADGEKSPGEPNPKHCSACGISFTYKSSYVAHKQFYCKAASSRQDANATEPGRAETPVSQGTPCQTASV